MKIYNAQTYLHYFARNAWNFKHDRMMELVDKVRPEDLIDFEVKREKFNVDEFILTASLGVKKYLLKENMNDIEKHKVRAKRYVSKIYATKFPLLLGITQK